jgi:hypothetical protein
MCIYKTFTIQRRWSGKRNIKIGTAVNIVRVSGSLPLVKVVRSGYAGLGTGTRSLVM